LLKGIKRFSKRILFPSKIELPANNIRNAQLYKRGTERSTTPSNGTKVIGLMRIRNEANIISFSLRALAQYTDAIIVFDDRSNDGTIEALQSLKTECKIEAIVLKKLDKFTESEDLNQLLQKGREYGGSHFVVLDADEALTSNFIEDKLLGKLILGLNPGDTLWLNWIQLWRTTREYRRDESIWTWNYKPIIFCDDGFSRIDYELVHANRVPTRSGKQYKLTGFDYGLLHFQFVNWRNLLVKQAWYRCLEKINLPDKSTDEINARYAPSKDESDLKTQTAQKEWFDQYPFWEHSIFYKPETWREIQVLKWFSEFGNDFFEDLDIWDIDWDYSKLEK